MAAVAAVATVAARAEMAARAAMKALAASEQIKVLRCDEKERCRKAGLHFLA